MNIAQKLNSPELRAAFNRKHLLGKLHGMKRDLGLDDDLYRDKLEALTGKRSAADLDEAQLQRAVDGFRRFGSARALIPATNQGRMLQGLWLSLYNLGLVEDNSDAALLAFVKRQTGIAKAEWLRNQLDVERVVEALKAWLTRDGGVNFAPRKGQLPYQRFPAYRVCEAQWVRLVVKGNKPEGTLLSFAAKVHASKGLDPEMFTSQHWGHVSRKLGYWVRGEQGRAA